MLGVRTALATMVPLIVGPMMSPTATTWMSTAGLLIAIADNGDAASAEALHRRHVAAVMMRLRDGIANAYDPTDRLYESRVAPAVQAPVASGTETPRVPLLRRLAEDLRTHPLQVRHAMRVCIMVTAAVIITRYLGLARGYWVTLNVIILLQPYTIATAINAKRNALAAGIAIVRLACGARATTRPST